VGAFVLLIAALGAAPAGALELSELAGPTGETDQEVAAASGGGETVVAWVTGEDRGFKSTLYISRRSKDGPWGPPEAISREASEWHNEKPGIAVDSHGDALIAWTGEVAEHGESHAQLFVADVPRGGPPGKPLDLWGITSGGNGIDPSCVAFDSAGNATVLWWASSGLYVVRRPAGGSFGAPQQIAGSDEGESVEYPRFAVAANGEAVAGGEASGARVWLLPAVGAPGKMQSLEKGARPLIGSFRTAIGPHGEAIAAWFTQGPLATEYEGWLSVAVRSAGASSFSPAEHVVHLPSLQEAPAVAVAPSGEMTVVYKSEPYLRAISRSPDGVWGTPERLGFYAEQPPPAASYDRAGNLYVAWDQHRDLGEPDPSDGYYAAVRPAGHTFGGRSILLSSPGRGGAWAPVLATEEDEATVAWIPGGEVEAVFAAGPLTPAPGESAPPTATPRTAGFTQPVAVGTASNQAASTPGPGASTRPTVTTAGARAATIIGSLRRLLRRVAAAARHREHIALPFQALAGGELSLLAGPPARSRSFATRTLGRWRLLEPGSYLVRPAIGRLERLLAKQHAIALTAVFVARSGRTLKLELLVR
jgi:hypothetical protein